MSTVTRNKKKTYTEDAAWSREVQDILTGLTATPKSIPSRFFYDDVGSKLFERITKLPEYYPSRTEKGILKRYAGEITDGFGDAAIIELGSGDCSKISILLRALSEGERRSLVYVSVDVSRGALDESGRLLRKRFGDITVRGIQADFTVDMGMVEKYDKKVLCLFGSTIGNLDPSDARDFIARTGCVMAKGDRFLLGLDMVKERAVLERAYNDALGVTAQFNRNILNVVNRVIGSDFRPELFEHLAFFNARHNRIEMHLKASRAMHVNTPLLTQGLDLEEGETIHTENSRKFLRDHILEFAAAGGFAIRRIHSDSMGWFCLVDYVKQ